MSFVKVVNLYQEEQGREKEQGRNEEQGWEKSRGGRRSREGRRKYFTQIVETKCIITKQGFKRYVKQT